MLKVQGLSTFVIALRILEALAKVDNPCKLYFVQLKKKVLLHKQKDFKE
jgi:hypothetical protein